jgi:hypothetical protein
LKNEQDFEDDWSRNQYRKAETVFTGSVIPIFPKLVDEVDDGQVVAGPCLVTG